MGFHSKVFLEFSQKKKKGKRETSKLIYHVLKSFLSLYTFLGTLNI